LRNLSVGSSHGVIVALTVYADASGHDLARGRHIAGTGRIAGDGSVGPIGGLAAKAAAARRAGADVLVFPGSQVGELAGFDPGAMKLVGVGTLEEAIAALRVEDPGT
jgi:Lon-like protease